MVEDLVNTQHNQSNAEIDYENCTSISAENKIRMDETLLLNIFSLKCVDYVFRVSFFVQLNSNKCGIAFSIVLNGMLNCFSLSFRNWRNIFYSFA